MAETSTPHLTRVSMSARYYQQMQSDLATAVTTCNDAYSLIRKCEGASYADLKQAIYTLDGMLRDIRNNVEAYCTPL